METVLTPPAPFCFEQNILNISSGSLSDSWKKWSKGFQIYFNACELSKKSPDTQTNILLHVIGEQCRELYEQFTSKSLTVDGILKQFNCYFEQRKNLTVERHKFFIRNQKDGETIEQYVYDLQKLATTCEFGLLCESLIRDRLICGISNSGIRERLLREPDLSLKQALDICQSVIVSKMYSESITTDNKENLFHVKGVNENNSDNNNLWNVRKNTGGGGGYRTSSQGRRARAVPRHASPERRAAPAPSSSREEWRSRRTAPSDQRHEAVTTRMYANMASVIQCNKCGLQHQKFKCPAYGVRCLKCARMNHYSRMCRVYQIEQSDEKVNSLNKTVDEWSVSLVINNCEIKFKIDTGADVNVLPRRYLKLINIDKQHLLKTSTKLYGYSGSSIEVLGKCFIKVKYKDVWYVLEFKIADVSSSPILGHDTCKELNLIKRIYSIERSLDKSFSCIKEFRDVFEGIGCLPGEYEIRVDKQIKPVVHAPRKVPMPIKDRVKEKLMEMETQGIIAKVEGPTDWVNSMTIVKKANGDLRICLDPKELNLAIKREYFRLPTLDEIISRLSGAQYFTTLDAKNGFWQVKLKNTDLCTFNTPFGRYKFLRMPYGISSACEVFHKKICENFDDIPGVCMYVDDILIFAKTKKQHDEILREVLERCRKINLKLNLDKCKFGLKEIKYLGHKITTDGLYPDESHVSAIVNMPKPKNTKDIERFLGLATYMSSFIKNFSEKTEPLRQLLRKDIEWHWTEIQENAFQDVKKCLAAKPVLQYYSMTAPITISVDASKSGLGAVLLQNGLPVSYASRSLTKTEQRYAQIEKELYACVFACERFYAYIYGRTDITIETDHKPLITIIKKPIVEAPPRLQRMLLRLQPFTFKLIYKPGKQLVIADALSRAYEPCDSTKDIIEDIQNEMTEAIRCVVSNNTLTDTHFQRLQKETEEDAELMELKEYIKKGWPENKNMLSIAMRPYWTYRSDLSESCGLLWKGERIIIPRKLRKEMLQKIHFSHLGLEKCKLRARELLFWPELNNQLKNLIENCQTCLTYKRSNKKEELCSHEVPNYPWAKVGVDLFYFDNRNYLLIVDYYSKFIEVIELTSTLSESIIYHLKSVFSRQGIPETLITDCGPQFTSRGFQNFAQEWGFQHIKTSPHYPQSNGQAERSVQTVKNLMKKSTHASSDYKLSLLEYLNTPISDNIPSPAEILQNRKLRSILPTRPTLLNHKGNVKIKEKLTHRQKVSKYYYDKNSKNLSLLKIGQKIKIRDLKRKMWISGTVTKILRKRSYEITLLNGIKVVRNRRHIIVDSLIRPETGFEYNADDDVAGFTLTPAPVNNIPPAPAPQSRSFMNSDNSNPYVSRFGRTVRRPIRWGFEQ